MTRHAAQTALSPPSQPLCIFAFPLSRPWAKPFLLPGSHLTVEGEDEAGRAGQTRVLGAPPGADRGGKQRGPRGQGLLLVPEAQGVRGLVTQHEVFLAVAKVQLPRVAVPVEAEVVEAPGLREWPRSRVASREGGMDDEGLLRVPDGDVELGHLLIMEAAVMRLVPLAAEAEVFPGAPATGT